MQVRSLRLSEVLFSWFTPYGSPLLGESIRKFVDLPDSPFLLRRLCISDRPREEWWTSWFFGDWRATLKLASISERLRHKADRSYPKFQPQIPPTSDIQDPCQFIKPRNRSCQEDRLDEIPGYVFG